MCEIDKDYIEVKILRLDTLLKILNEIFDSSSDFDLGFYIEIINEEFNDLNDSYQILYTKI